MAIDRNKVIAAAQKHIQKGSYKRAIKEYKKIMKVAPDDVRILLKIGDLEARDGQTSASVRTYNEVADHYVAHGFFLKAVAVYKQLLRLAPERVDARLRLADLYFQLSLLRDAMANYQEVANMLLEMGRVDQYLQTLERVVEIDPDNAGNRIKLAEQLAKFGHEEAAASEFFGTAGLLKESGRFEEYTKVAERYIHLAPTDLEAVFELAEVYLRQGRAKRALAKVQVLFREDPRNPRVVDVLVRALDALGEKSRAIEVLRELAHGFDEDGAIDARDELYRRLLEIEPGDAEARDALGLDAVPVMTFELVGEEAPAGEPATANIDPADIDKLLGEADIYLKYNLHEKALEHLRNIFELDPNNLAALERRKTALIATGQTELAVSVLIGMARLVFPTDEVQATMHLHQALAAAPDHPNVLAVLREFEEGVVATEVIRDEAEPVVVVPGESSSAAPSQALAPPPPDDVSPVPAAASAPADASARAESVPGDPMAAAQQVGTASQGPEDGRFDKLDALFDEFQVEDTSAGHRTLEDDQDFIQDVASSIAESVPDAGEPSSDTAVLSLATEDFLPADLDVALEDVENYLEVGDIESGRARIFELLGEWPEHAELLLRRMDELPSPSSSSAIEGGARVPTRTPASPPVAVGPEDDHDDLFLLEDDAPDEVLAGDLNSAAAAVAAALDGDGLAVDEEAIAAAERHQIESGLGASAEPEDSSADAEEEEPVAEFELLDADDEGPPEIAVSDAGDGAAPELEVVALASAPSGVGVEAEVPALGTSGPVVDVGASDLGYASLSDSSLGDFDLDGESDSGSGIEEADAIDSDAIDADASGSDAIDADASGSGLEFEIEPSDAAADSDAEEALVAEEEPDVEESDELGDAEESEVAVDEADDEAEDSDAGAEASIAGDDETVLMDADVADEEELAEEDLVEEIADEELADEEVAEEEVADEELSEEEVAEEEVAEEELVEEELSEEEVAEEELGDEELGEEELVEEEVDEFEIDDADLDDVVEFEIDDADLDEGDEIEIDDADLDEGDEIEIDDADLDDADEIEVDDADLDEDDEIEIDDADLDEDDEFEIEIDDAALGDADEIVIDDEALDDEGVAADDELPADTDEAPATEDEALEGEEDRPETLPLGTMELPPDPEPEPEPEPDPESSPETLSMSPMPPEVASVDLGSLSSGAFRRVKPRKAKGKAKSKRRSDGLDALSALVEEHRKSSDYPVSESGANEATLDEEDEFDHDEAADTSPPEDDSAVSTDSTSSPGNSRMSPDAIVVAEADIEDEFEVFEDFEDDDADFEDVNEDSFLDIDGISDEDAHNAAENARAQDIDAPIGRASRALAIEFGPSETVLEDAPSSELADAIRLRRDGNGMIAMVTLQEEVFGDHPLAATFDLSIANLEMGLYFEAITTLEQLLERDLPSADHLVVHYYLGIAYEALAQEGEAQQHFLKVIDAHPEAFADVWIRLDRMGGAA